MWYEMPSEVVVCSSNDMKGSYRLDNGEIALRGLNHPAGGLGWERLAKVIREIVDPGAFQDNSCSCAVLSCLRAWLAEAP